MTDDADVLRANIEIVKLEGERRVERDAFQRLWKKDPRMLRVFAGFLSDEIQNRTSLVANGSQRNGPWSIMMISVMGRARSETSQPFEVSLHPKVERKSQERI